MQQPPKSEIEAGLTEVLEMCPLQDFSGRPIHAVSGDGRQRVALVRDIAPRPRMVPPDEPLSALDVTLREALRDELAVLPCKFDITAILVAHAQDEAMANADRAGVMSYPPVVESGTPEELYRNPNLPSSRGLSGMRCALRAPSKPRSRI